MRHLSIDLEGGWAYPIEKLDPDAPLTSKLAKDSYWAEEIKAICEGARTPVVFATVLDAIDPVAIDRQVEKYAAFWGSQHRDLACRLYDLRDFAAGFSERPAGMAKIGVHSFDHSIMENTTEAQLNEMLHRAVEKVSGDTFTRYFVFPQNVLPKEFWSFSLPEGWDFRCSFMRNPRVSRAKFLKVLRYLRRDRLVQWQGNRIYKSESYFPLTHNARAAALRLMCRARLGLGFCKYPWTHAWELEQGVSIDMLAHLISELGRKNR